MINKYANIYDKDGNLVRQVNPKTGRLDNYTIPELEQLIDKLAADKDENGKIKDPNALNNVYMVLTQLYKTEAGVAHLKKMAEEWQKRSEALKQTDIQEQITDAMNELKEELEKEENNSEIVHKVESNLDEEYVNFEEVEDGGLQEQA